MTAAEIPIPPTPGPFVNTPLLWIDEGKFWISSYNPVNGSVGVTVGRGSHRAYALGAACPGAYSAVADGAGALWLCGDLASVRRLDLATGAVEVFDTGHSAALVFQGMYRDPQTGRLFIVAFDGRTTDCVVFDTVRGRTVATLTVPGPWRYLRGSFVADGVPHLIVETPGLGVIRILAADTTPELEVLDLTPDLAAAALAFVDTEVVEALVRGQIRCDHPWVRAANAVDGLRCLGIRAETAICAYPTADAAAVVLLSEGGESEQVAEIPDAMPFNVALDDEEIIAVDAFGVLSRHTISGAPTIDAQDLDLRAAGAVDVVIPIDARTLLGSTFISQRFWTVDVVSGDGCDRGRAAPGFGEVLQAIRHRGRVLMAAYSGGEVMSWDPEAGGGYPENPRVVLADAESMRPVALLSCGRTVFYAASRYYGMLGSRIMELDPVSGSATAIGLDALRITGALRTPSGAIIAGSTVHADARSASPSAERCALLAYAVSPLREVARLEIDRPWDHVFVHGMLTATRVLCSGWNPIDETEEWFSVEVGAGLVLSSAPARVAEIADRRVFAGRPDVLAGRSRIRPTEAIGRFVIHVEDRFELWDMNAFTRVALITRAAEAYAFEVDDEILTIVEPTRMRRIPLSASRYGR